MSRIDDMKNFREWHATKLAYEKMNHDHRLPEWEELSGQAQLDFIKQFKQEGHL